MAVPYDHFNSSISNEKMLSSSVDGDVKIKEAALIANQIRIFQVQTSETYA